MTFNLVLSLSDHIVKAVPTKPNNKHNYILDTQISLYCDKIQLYT